MTEIVQEQREGIRGVLVDGMAQGENPRQVALGIVGRVNRATGRREGGLIGLTSQQMGWVRNARAELADPDRLGDYLRREARDRRYDKLVMRAMRDGRALSQADIDRVTGRYADRLLKLRGDTIARTEAIHSTHAGAREGIRQLLDSGAIQENQVRKVWSATLDGRTRDSHRALHGASARYNEAFISPATGAMMLHPGDSSQGAPGQDVINCRCFMNYRIDWRPND